MVNSKMLYLFFLFIHLCSVHSFNSKHECSDEQRDALLLIKENISTLDNDRFNHQYYLYTGERYYGRPHDYCRRLLGYAGYHPVIRNWNTNTDCCQWDGVSCNNVTGDVIGLDLRCGRLKGVLKLFTLLSSLPHLEVLDLSYNGLSVVTKNITTNVNSDLRVLGLANCELNVFPEFLRAMKKLAFLDLAGNKIRGLIPDWAGEVGGNKLVYLDLSNNFITGLSLFQWSGLEHLYLQSNRIRGQFPLLICDMNNLKYLDISKNGFGGMVPGCLGNSKSLVSLNVEYNMIQGPVPLSICDMDNLKYLDLSYNNFSGMFPQCLENSRFLLSLNIKSNIMQGPFPTTICNMTHLKYLDMSNNGFYGVIPECFENITSSLLMLNLGYNYFSSTIPNVNENCTLSEGLILNNNRLEGDVPRSLLKCQDLKVLDLGNNHLEGRFPRWLEGVTKLEVLILKSNNLHGAIETSSTMGFPFSRLKIFDVSHNGFVGRLPGEYFENFNAIKDVDKNPNGNHVNISGLSYSIIVPVNSEADRLPQVIVEFSVIDLSSNKFEGEIPNVIGSFNSLVALNLSHNNLIGQIPHELGNLLAVQALDLSWNQLSGEIPQSLAEIRSLVELDLSQNHLEGRVPQGPQFNTFGKISYEGNPGLCGYPLRRRCEGIVPAQVDDDEDDGIFPWKVMVLGYGCGTLLGILLGYRMLSTKKPRWFNTMYGALERIIPVRQKKRKRVNTKKRNQNLNGTYVLNSRRSLYRNNFAV